MRFLGLDAGMKLYFFLQTDAVRSCCWPSPCQNNATCGCADASTESKCLCPTGYTGKHCEKRGTTFVIIPMPYEN